MNTEDLHRNMIAFGNWLLHNGLTGELGIWRYYEDQVIVYKTTEELFQIYLKQLNNE